MMDTKKLVSLGEAALAELKVLKDLGELSAVVEFSNAIKEVDESELVSISPMLPTYVDSMRKNIGFLRGNYNSVITHAENRTGEIQAFMGEITKRN